MSRRDPFYTKSPSPERPSKRIKHEDEKDDQEKLHESSAKDRQHSAKQDQEDIESDVKQENEGLPHDSSSHGENVTSGSLPPETFGGFTHERTNGLLEKGHLYFVYRPKVEHDHAESLDDVARFQLLLFPSTGKESVLHRTLAIGRKHMPDSERHEVIWGSVVELGDDVDKLRDGLREETYQTKTQGERHVGAARLAGRGSYIIYSVDNAPKDSQDMSKKYSTYLAYHLTVPQEPGPVQDELKIEKEGVLHLQVKNPSAPSTNPRVRDQPGYRQPKFPHELKKYFKTRFIPANPAALLNYPGAELLFIGTKHKLGEVLGEERVEQLKSEEDEPETAQQGIEAVKKELHFSQKVLDLEPLLGHWD